MQNIITINSLKSNKEDSDSFNAGNSNSIIHIS